MGCSMRGGRLKLCTWRAERPSHSSEGVAVVREGDSVLEGIAEGRITRGCTEFSSAIGDLERWGCW